MELPLRVSAAELGSCELVLPSLELRVEVSVLGAASCDAAGATAFVQLGETVAVPRCTDGPRRAGFRARLSLRSSVVVFLEVPLLVHFLFGERCVGRNASLFVNIFISVGA